MGGLVIFPAWPSIQDPPGPDPADELFEQALRECRASYHMVERIEPSQPMALERIRCKRCGLVFVEEA